MPLVLTFQLRYQNQSQSCGLLSAAASGGLQDQEEVQVLVGSASRACLCSQQRALAYDLVLDESGPSYRRALQAAK